jgi:trans-aconitate methyltransferase
MTAPVRAASSWLALREAADSGARSTDLADALTRLLPSHGPLVIHDLGGGTGSMMRWLAPRLPGPQQWVVHDRDADLLAEANQRPGTDAGGRPVSVQTRADDITRLPAAELSGAALLTASALLDMLTGDEVERFADVCAAATCPVLIALTVTGHVDLDPGDSLDGAIRDAFNAHQRGDRGAGVLLGPDAVPAAAEALRRRGADVAVRPSPWRLAADDTAVILEWLTGWVGAAGEQEPALLAESGDYLRRRRSAAQAGRLQVTVHHDDLLAVPQ